jgi:hypothetical protein
VVIDVALGIMLIVAIIIPACFAVAKLLERYELRRESLHTGNPKRH